MSFVGRRVWPWQKEPPGASGVSRSPPPEEICTTPTVAGNDAAGRLVQAGEVLDPLSLVPNNSRPGPEAIAGLPTGYGYGIDEAENPTVKITRQDGVAELTTFPLDSSGGTAQRPSTG